MEETRKIRSEGKAEAAPFSSSLPPRSLAATNNSNAAHTATPNPSPQHTAKQVSATPDVLEHAPLQGR